jgi:hypothetical protein
MTINTPQLALPKPEATDLLVNGFDAIADLADRVEALLDAAFIGLPLASGMTSHADSFGHAPGYRRFANDVQLRGTIRRTSGAAFDASVQTTIAVLPVGFRPVETIFQVAACSNSGGGPQLRCDIGVDGQVSVTPLAGSTPTWVSLDTLQFSRRA